jgi:penicillin-binding protein 1A
MKLVEGASTLTQQLIKTKVLTRDKKIIRKIKEILLSIRLEQTISKEAILQRYLNEVYFGHGYYGIRTASLGYFKKELNDLSLKEIAILVGLPRAPSFYDPTKNYKFAIIRANQVINRLKKLGWINHAQYLDAISSEPKVYNQSLSQNKAPYLVDEVVRQLKNELEDLKTGGYKIVITADLKAQQIASDAIKFGYEKIKIRDSRDDNKTFTEKLNGSMLVMENHTGKILAMVGGVDYKKSSFNRVTQAQRQPGSSIKPLLYQVALNLGYSPASNLVDISRTYEYKDKENETKKWQPKNYEKNFKGLITLREALVHSRNLATINLVTDIGVDVVYRELIRFGLKNIPLDLSITLGSFSISSIDLAEQYSLFANNGTLVKPYLIHSIETKDGDKKVFERDEKFIQDEAQSFLTTTILRDVVQRGTGRGAKIKGLETAGKTGTTNNNVDAWFCGYTPSLLSVVWFGNDDNTPMRRKETGGRSSAPPFKYFFKRWMEIHPEIPRKFVKPDGVKDGYMYGKKEYYTDLSKLPQSEDKVNTKFNDIVY